MGDIIVAFSIAEASHPADIGRLMYSLCGNEYCFDNPGIGVSGSKGAGCEAGLAPMRPPDRINR